jgi:hypothetical protein
MYEIKANIFIYNMSKFLADTTTIKCLVIFLISEFMFFGPKKEITPWREALFNRINPAAVRKGLKNIWAISKIVVLCRTENQEI